MNEVMKEGNLPSSDVLEDAEASSLIQRVIYALLLIAAITAPMLIPGVGIKELMVGILGLSVVVFCLVPIWGTLRLRSERKSRRLSKKN